MRIGFRFRLVPCIATVLLVALGISLGNWQQRRAEQKTALQHKLAEGNAAAPLSLSSAGGG
ncbi:MAG: SURF1 family cytochrome oxidase biogenesis protein, partial [Pseudomonadota bacterium]